MADGIGCKCAAYAQHECCCDADWTPSEVYKLREELESLRRDAERYRWLRKQHWSESELCVVKSPKDAVKLGCYCPADELLDAAIDAAMKGEKG